jgi:hypothetical protein
MVVGTPSRWAAGARRTSRSRPSRSRRPPRHSSQQTPGATTAVDADDEYAALEAEMAEVRRWRAEVTARYQRRLEYLRARLKEAEMNEKLLKK